MLMSTLDFNKEKNVPVGLRVHSSWDGLVFVSVGSVIVNGGEVTADLRPPS